MGADDMWRQEEDNMGGLLHLQGYDPVIKITNTERQRGPGTVPDPKAAKERRRRRPSRYRGKFKACGKFGHEETRCQFLAMFLYCKKYMEGRSEHDIQSVFEHSFRRNEEDVPFEEVKRRVGENGMTVNRMALEMDWAHFAPLTFEETYMVADGEDSSQVEEDEDE